MLMTLSTRTPIFLLLLLATLTVAVQITQAQAPASVTNTSLTVSKQTVSSASTILPIAEVRPSKLPDFTNYRDVRTKKQEFFNYMLPMVRHANDRILNDRSLLLAIRNDLRSGVVINPDDVQFVGELARVYRVKSREHLASIVDILLIRVDVVPESLVLAQSANESGWGTSRFAREANNLFGVWCFTRGCGVTPRSRDDGLTHEVARYDCVQDSVNAYIHTINTNGAYLDLRQIRATSRDGEQHISGLALAEGLKKYSSRGIDYVREIQQLIRVNNLQRFNLPLAA